MLTKTVSSMYHTKMRFMTVSGDGDGFRFRLARPRLPVFLAVRGSKKAECLSLVFGETVVCSWGDVPFLAAGCRDKSSLCKLSVYESTALKTCVKEKKRDKWQFCLQWLADSSQKTFEQQTQNLPSPGSVLMVFERFKYDSVSIN